MKLVRNNTFNNPILLVDGHACSGKSKIARVLECYNGVEKSKEDDMFYMVLKLYEIGKIKDDATKVILNTIVDRLTYNQLISREINFKISDITSFLRYPYPLEYIKRIFHNNKKEVCSKINSDYPILQNMTTNAIIDSNILFKSFGDRLRIIYLMINPIVTIYNAYKNGYGKNVGTDPTNIMLTYGDIPIDAINYKKEYPYLNEMDRVIKWVYDETLRVNESYNNLSCRWKQNIFFLDFNEFLINPKKCCNRISCFIHQEPSWKLNRVIRGLYPETSADLNEKKKFIESKASKVMFELIDKIDENDTII